ncbi:hypothetical protein C8R42DRAFT_729153 [Lentinula raphanica]|nr:hypothetical protein C8R42DRAFT_729153 [Lentinula raphanica]
MPASEFVPPSTLSSLPAQFHFETKRIMDYSDTRFISEQLASRSERALHQQHHIKVEIEEQIQQLATFKIDILDNSYDIYRHDKELKPQAQSVKDLSEVMDISRENVKLCLKKIRGIHDKAISIQKEANITQIRILAMILKIRTETTRDMHISQVMTRAVDGALTSMFEHVEKVDDELEG